MYKKYTKRLALLVVVAAVLVPCLYYSLSGSHSASNTPGKGSDVTESGSESIAKQSYQKLVNSNNTDSALDSNKVADVSNARRAVWAGTTREVSGQKIPIYEYEALAAPNDPYAVQDWTNDTKMQAAWDIGYGNTETTIAIIDSGFSLQHQEFTNRWLENEGEKGSVGSENPSRLNCTDRSLPISASCNLIDDDFDTVVDNETGSATVQNPSRLNCTDQSLPLDKSCNLIDDDGNGYADDVRGWDFVNYDRSVAAGQTNPSGNTTGHGTMVTGVAAATGNNNVGIAGVNWNSKVLPLQVIDDNGYGNTLTLSRAIEYAVERGVDVINLSLGSENQDNYLRSVIDDAIEAGVIVVASAGNDGCDCLRYPASFPEVFSVGSVNQSGNKSSFSNTGADLDIMAPGENLRSTTWAQGSTTSYINNIDGTSFSAPIVSGLLALAKSHQPDATWAELTGTLTGLADKVPLGTTVHRSDNYGFGRLDAAMSMSRVVNPTSVAQETRLGPQLVTDPLGSYRVNKCYEGYKGGTPVYELSKSKSYKFTVSELTKLNYVEDGWTVKLVAYGCVSLPTDEPDTIRSLNLVNELRQLTTKDLY